jgi:hypothetical protein
MSATTKTVLVALLFFGSASSVFAGTNLGNDHYRSITPRRAVSVTVSNDRVGDVNRAVKLVAPEEKAWFVPPQLALVQSDRSVVIALPTAR